MSCEYFDFLDSLRITGVTNMMGAGSYLKEFFEDLTAKEARTILSAWMQTYNEDLTAEARWELAVEQELVP